MSLLPCARLISMLQGLQLLLINEILKNSDIYRIVKNDDDTIVFSAISTRVKTNFQFSAIGVIIIISGCVSSFNKILKQSQLVNQCPCIYVTKHRNIKITFISKIFFRLFDLQST